MTGVYEGPIRLVLFDVDGVLTDGQLHITAEGELFKSFNAKDGVAVALLKAHGIRCGVVSGKSSSALDYRIRQLGFDYPITGCHDKRAALAEVATQSGIALSETVFVGDDIIDLLVMQAVGLSYAPADAHELVRCSASYVLQSSGGQGVAREVAEHILYAGGLNLAQMYAPLLEQYCQQ